MSNVYYAEEARRLIQGHKTGVDVKLQVAEEIIAGTKKGRTLSGIMASIADAANKGQASCRISVGSDLYDDIGHCLRQLGYILIEVFHDSENEVIFGKIIW